MKSFKGAGKFLGNVNKKSSTTRRVGIKKSEKKRALTRKKFMKKYRLKTLKEKIGKKTKQLAKMYEERDETEYESYENIIKGFRVLFKNVIKQQENLEHSMNNDKKMELDNIIIDITDKLENIEKNGNILKRIKNESREVYEIVKSMYTNINVNTKLPTYSLIEYYLEIIDKLLDNINVSKVSDVITLLSIDLTSEFFHKEKIEKDELEDDLSDLFSGLKVSKNSVDDLLEGLSTMKF